MTDLLNKLFNQGDLAVRPEQLSLLADRRTVEPWVQLPRRPFVVRVTCNYDKAAGQTEAWVYMCFAGGETYGAARVAVRGDDRAEALRELRKEFRRLRG